MLIVITSPTSSLIDISYYASLFDIGLHSLHLRLPNHTRVQYEEAILRIPQYYRNRVIICDYLDLAYEYGLGGVHLRHDNRDQYHNWVGTGYRVSVSAHSIEELYSLPFIPTYALLSPVFDSISKDGYTATIDLEECKYRLKSLPFPVLGLGGVTPDNISLLLEHGFYGAAVLGYISKSGKFMNERYSLFPLPEVLTIAGHDPSSGAGLISDALTIQGLSARPITVTSVLTIQDEGEFNSLISIPDDNVINTLTFLLERGHIPYSAKIGMLSSLNLVLDIAIKLKEYGVKHIIWDPVLSASAGKENTILYELKHEVIEEILSVITLITPNVHESILIFGTDNPIKLREIAKKRACSILLKGGHTSNKFKATDILISHMWDNYIEFDVPRTCADKHGTGCMLSASIAAHLSLGYTLEQACRQSQFCVDEYRRSSNKLIGNMNYNLRNVKYTRMKNCTVQFITNSSNKDEILLSCMNVLDGGIRWIQLRMKNATHEERVDVALSLKRIMNNYIGSTLIIDDDIDAVIESDADGVHLGLNDDSPIEARKKLGYGKIIGGTCNTTEQLYHRAIEGVDYVGVGPYRYTKTKTNLSPILGYEGIKSIVLANKRLALPIPIYVIGGIVLDDIKDLENLDIKGIAISSLLLHSENMCSTAYTIKKVCDKSFIKY